MYNINKMKKVYFICVHYNNAEVTFKYINSINSLINEQWFHVSIVIVDNNSDLLEVSKLTDFLLKYPNTKLIKNETNLGYFGGLNSGIETIEFSETAFLVVGNNDMMFNSDFLHELYNMTALENHTYVLAPDIVNLDGDHQNPVSVNRLSFLRRLWLDIYHSSYYIGIPLYSIIEKIRKKTNNSSKLQFDRKIPITIGYGACYILSEYFIKQFGKLDDSVFLYGEEALLANQVKSAGGEILYCPNLVVHHLEHRSINKVEPKTLYMVKKQAYKKYRDLL